MMPIARLEQPMLGLSPASISRRLAVLIGVVVLTATAASASGLTRAQSEAIYSEYLTLLERDEGTAFAERLVRAAEGEHADDEIALAGACLAVRAGCAPEVLDALARRGSVEAATVHGELLQWLARGDDRPSWARKLAPTQPEPLPTEELGQRAGEWLDHPDPFVRGLAEWAIAIRLHREYECAEQRVDGYRRGIPWPARDKAPWYDRWLAIPDAALVELDHVRQAVARGQHRNGRDLLAAAEEAMARLIPLRQGIFICSSS